MNNTTLEEKLNFINQKIAIKYLLHMLKIIFLKNRILKVKKKIIVDRYLI